MKFNLLEGNPKSFLYYSVLLLGRAGKLGEGNRVHFGVGNFKLWKLERRENWERIFQKFWKENFEKILKKLTEI